MIYIILKLIGELFFVFFITFIFSFGSIYCLIGFFNSRIILPNQLNANWPQNFNVYTKKNARIISAILIFVFLLAYSVFMSNMFENFFDIIKNIISFESIILNHNVKDVNFLDTFKIVSNLFYIIISLISIFLGFLASKYCYFSSWKRYLDGEKYL